MAALGRAGVNEEKDGTSEFSLILHLFTAVFSLRRYVGIQALDKALLQENYYHGIVQREEVEQRLVKDGDFLVCIPDDATYNQVSSLRFLLPELFVVGGGRCGRSVHRSGPLFGDWEDETRPLPHHGEELRFDPSSRSTLHLHSRGPQPPTADCNKKSHSAARLDHHPRPHSFGRTDRERRVSNGDLSISSLL